MDSYTHPAAWSTRYFVRCPNRVTCHRCTAPEEPTRIAFRKLQRSLAGFGRRSDVSEAHSSGLLARLSDLSLDGRRLRPSYRGFELAGGIVVVSSSM